MSTDGQGTKLLRKIAENYNCLSRVHERYRRQTDRRTGDTGEKAFERTVCSKLFSRRGAVSAHQRRMHTGEKPYKCHVCDKAFSGRGHLTCHMRVHNEVKRYKCNVCNRASKRSGHLQQHERSLHSNTRPYHCSYCGQLFTRRSRMTHIILFFTLIQSCTRVNTVQAIYELVSN